MLEKKQDSCDNSRRRFLLTSPAPLALLLLGSGCSEIWYQGCELVGYEKRDILVHRVKGGRNHQVKAKKEFTSALDRFKEVVHVPVCELDSAYSKLKTAYERSESRAQSVADSIESIEKVSKALFKEWRKETRTIVDGDLRYESHQMFLQAQSNYDIMIDAMRDSYSSMSRVLVRFRDQVTFVKHNLNVIAVSSLQGEVRTIEMDVEYLIADMERAIRESDQFLNSMG